MQAALYEPFTGPDAEHNVGQLLQGTWQIPSSVPYPTQRMLQACRIPEGQRPLVMAVTVQNHRSFWRKMDERKGSEP